MDPKNKVKNRSIDLNNLYETHLSIQLGLNGFSFCVLDKTYSLVQKLAHHPFKDPVAGPEDLLARIQNIFEKEKLLQHKYGSVNVSHVNELSSLVPKPFFDESKLKEYIRYSSKTFDNDYIVWDEIENHDLINVYIPFVNINNFLLERFGSFEYKHFSTVLITNLLSTYRYSEHPHIFIYLEKNRMYVVGISENKLQLYNSFPFKTKEDFLYYLLFAAEQLEMNPETFELILSGEIDKKSEIYDMAFNYVRKTSLIENRFKYEFDPSVSESLKRRHMTLIHQY